MKIQHHLDDATLMSCAAGSQPEAFAAVVSSHLLVCPRCRSELKQHSLIGEALFEGLSPVPVTREAPVVALGAGEADLGGEEVTSEIPPILKSALAGSSQQVPWRRMAPGVWHCPIPLSKGAQGDLRLLKVAPGTVLPEHGHGGTELTIVLEGSYTDAFGTFRRGDVADLGDDVEHRPVADAVEGCVCLVASDQKARFKGLVARLIQPLTGL